jgi:hypothetical protein
MRHKLKGKGLFDVLSDLPTGLHRVFTTVKNDIKELTKEEKLYAQIAKQAYSKTPKEKVESYSLIFNDKRIKVYKKGDNIIFGIRGTEKSDEMDIYDDLLIATHKLVSDSPRFKQLVDVYKAVKETFPDANISFAGHSLGGGMIYYLTQLFKDEIKGHVFNPAISMQMMRSKNLDLSNIKAHIIEGDPVSGHMGFFLKNRTIYNNPNKLDGTIGDHLKAHELNNFL